MNRLLFLTAAVTTISYFTSAQTKTSLTAKINTPTVQCDMCKERIESYLKRYDGVLSVNVNVKKKETTVKYLTDRTNIENIKTAIANKGYEADNDPANTDAY